jgi:hypothetical protein
MGLAVNFLGFGKPATIMAACAAVNDFADLLK